MTTCSKRQLPQQMQKLLILAVVVGISIHSWANARDSYPTTFAGPCRSTSQRLVVRRAEDGDTMGDLFTKYYRLQEVNRNMEADTKIAMCKELLEILDDLERGAQHSSNDESGNSSLRNIASKFRSRLESLGFSPVKTEGEVFDPNVHEAASQRPAPGFKAGEVCEELRSGWMLGDKLVRPAVVTLAL
eukprot:TRINITY_DN7315_c0_g2_i1.p1 TRINITY_DN7315_c0_g2~~TRINITY_DN7315_c0_g2_i1.p1  ORF type:complete len:188 (+),score=23.06 TRINITY_DN7315_c0_g2_i1:144-707(+)